MTNAEAIEYIKKNCYGEWCEDDWREAMDMAIKALEVQGHTCLTCARCSDNFEHTTRCPIEEHYVLPKDGHCHLCEQKK